MGIGCCFSIHNNPSPWFEISSHCRKPKKVSRVISSVPIFLNYVSDDRTIAFKSSAFITNYQLSFLPQTRTSFFQRARTLYAFFSFVSFHLIWISKTHWLDIVFPVFFRTQNRWTCQCKVERSTNLELKCEASFQHHGNDPNGVTKKIFLRLSAKTQLLLTIVEQKLLFLCLRNKFLLRIVASVLKQCFSFKNIHLKRPLFVFLQL